MSGYIKIEHVPGIGRVINENGKRRLISLTEGIAEAAKEPCIGSGGHACDCCTCAARRSIALGMRNLDPDAVE